MNKKKKTIIMAAALAVFIIAVVIAWAVIKPGAVQGSKRITVEVDHLEGKDGSFIILTDEEYLRGALEQEKLVGGEESAYGLFVTTVDGETADADQEQWWGYTVNGEFAEYGVDEQPINDGDVYVFTLNVGYSW